MWLLSSLSRFLLFSSLELLETKGVHMQCVTDIQLQRQDINYNDIQKDLDSPNTSTDFKDSFPMKWWIPKQQRYPLFHSRIRSKAPRRHLSSESRLERMVLWYVSLENMSISLSLKVLWFRLKTDYVPTSLKTVYIYSIYHIPLSPPQGFQPKPSAQFPKFMVLALLCSAPRASYSIAANQNCWWVLGCPKAVFHVEQLIENKVWRKKLVMESSTVKLFRFPSTCLNT